MHCKKFIVKTCSEKFVSFVSREDMVLGILEFFSECSFVFKILTMVIGVSIVVSFAYKMNLKKERKVTKKTTKSK